MVRRIGAVAVLVVCAVGVVGFAQPVAGQSEASDSTAIPPREEARMLREASSHEWRGRLEEAEDVLTRLLDRNPASSGGLFALERILRARDRVAAVLPYVDRYLARSPDASGPRYMKLRVLVELDSLNALPVAAEDWFTAEPGSADPYREVGRIYQRAYGDERALEVFLAGREAVGDDGALALEIGDLRADMGDFSGAVEEWARALRDPHADLDGVLRRVERLEGDREALAAPIFGVLTADGATEERRRTAVRVAIELGPPALAQRVAEAGLRGLGADAAPGFLQEVARRADAADMAELSLWALSTLRRTAPAAAGDAAVEARTAAAALAVGDTIAATDAQRRLARALPPGSTERRRAIVDLIRIEAVASFTDVATLVDRLRGFGAEYPDAPELDGLTAEVAVGLAARGDEAGALRLVDPVLGPRSGLERAWLLLGSGEIEAGRKSLGEALSGLAPTDATEVIQLMSLLDRVGPGAAGALAESGARLRHGDSAEARRILEVATDETEGDDQAAVLFQSARLAVADGDTAAALQWFARIEGAHPDSPEAAEAMLRHARLLAADPAWADQARSLLERLILERPRAAVVPDARRELDRLGRGS